MMRTFFHSMLSIITVREHPFSGGLPLSTFALLSTLSMFFKRILIFYRPPSRSDREKNERNEDSRHQHIHKHADTQATTSFIQLEAADFCILGFLFPKSA